MNTYLHASFSLLDIARSFIEILILAVGIYWLWKFFRGTRGARVLAGFGFRPGHAFARWPTCCT